MFQSLNYFKIFNCPFVGTCTRPYCVFKHSLKQQQQQQESTTIITTSGHQTELENDTPPPPPPVDTDTGLGITLEKVKSLINSCDSSIDPEVLKKQIDELLTKPSVVNKPLGVSKNKVKKKNSSSSSTSVPDYNPTPIHELNKIKKDVVCYSSDYLEYNLNIDEEINENNKRTLDNRDDDDDDDRGVKKSKIFDLEDVEKKENETELKKLLQQKTESVIRKMNNPMAYIATVGAPSSLKIDRTSLQQQLKKRYEVVAAQKAKEQITTVNGASAGKAPQVADQTKRPTKLPTNNVNQPKLIIDSTNKVPLSYRQRYLNFIYEESKHLFASAEKACEKAAEQEKSIYDRAKTRNIYANLAAHLVKSLREQNNKKPTTPAVPKSTNGAATSVIATKTSLKLVNTKTTAPTAIVKQRVAYSHEAILAGPAAAKVSYSINRKKTLTLKDLNPIQLYNMLKVYMLTEKQLEENGYPLVYPKSKSEDSNELLAYIPKPVAQQTTISKYSIQNHTITNAKYSASSDTLKLCKRCTKTFTITKGSYEYVARDECVHHWGKLRKVRVNKVLEQRYSCCSQDSKAEGCQIGKHVYEGDDYEANQPLSGYVQTQEATGADNNIYALDCEMCYTTKGLELTRVSVIDKNLKSVYETIVVPDYEILDYNTRWSGLTKDSFKNCNVKLKNVQNDLLKLFHKDTILIGHSLESDFKALKIIHKTVVDTSVVFPHKMGAPFKRALKNLVCELLQKFIQEDTSGHDSKEDACACMELILWKIEQDLRK